MSGALIDDSALKVQVEQLTFALEEAQELIAQFRAILKVDKALPEGLPKLTQTQQRLLQVLINRHFVSFEMAMWALYSDRLGDWPDANIGNVFICQLRRRLAATPIKIITHWGQGWSLAPEGRDYLNELKEQQVLAAVNEVVG